MIGVRFGLYVMAIALVSMIVTIPMGIGMASGIGFASGMVVSWISGLWVVLIWVSRRAKGTVH